MTELTVVIPTFNEIDNINPLVNQLNRHLAAVDAEILFIDDSTDQTPERIAQVAATSTVPVRVLHRTVPMGRLAGAVITGLRHATSPWVVVMDGDLQHPPEAVPQLYHRARCGGGDVVVASRYIDGGTAEGLDSGVRRVVSSSAGALAKLLFPRRLAACTDPMSGFFAIRPSAIRVTEVTQCGYKVLLALLVHRQLTVSEVPFRFAERHAGESKASFAEGLRYVRLLLLLRVNMIRRASAARDAPLPA